MRRQTNLPSRPLSVDVIEGFERRVGERVPLPTNKLPEIFSLRAMVRDLISHLNTLERREEEIAS